MHDESMIHLRQTTLLTLRSYWMCLNRTGGRTGQGQHDSGTEKRVEEAKFCTRMLPRKAPQPSSLCVPTSFYDHESSLYVADLSIVCVGADGALGKHCAE